MSDGTIEINFGEGINVKHAEAAISRLCSQEARRAPITLDFSACRHMDAGVGWRLGNVLRLHAGRGAITARVPQVASAKDFEGDWFRVFTRSGFGQTLSSRASRILSAGIDVTELVAEHYRGLEDKPSNNFASVSQLTHPENIDADDFSAFIRQFARLASRVGIDPDFAQKDELRPLSKLCFEAIQNVRDHADRHPLPPDASTLSRFLLSYYKTLSRVSPWPGDFRGYVDRTEAHLGGGAENPGFVEIVVADDGVGIAARQALNESIYDGPLEKEQSALIEALKTGGSVKLFARDTTVRGDPGYGFTYIIDGLRSLQAYAVLRTGRLLTTFDGTTDALGFDLLPQGFGYLPGTVLDVIFPKPTLQLRLPGT